MKAGKLTYHGQRTLRANQVFRAEVVIESATAIQPGGRLVLAARHMSDLGDPQMDDPQAENYIEVISRQGTAWELMPANDWKRHPWNRGIDLRLTAGELAAGDAVRVLLGPEGSCGYRAQSFVEESFRFRLGIAPDGEQWLVNDDEPMSCRVIGNAATALRVTVSAVNGTTQKVHLKPEDAYGNVASSGPAEVELWLDDHRFLGKEVLAAGKPVELDVELPTDGRHWVTAATADASLFGRSNPFGPSMNGLQLYWGEIHAQSGLCDGTNSPAYLYDYARHAAGLDFASVTSHDFELTPGDWEEITAATKAAHVPGEFVTFLGYEWSGAGDRGGDHNIYFLDDEGPLIYNGSYRAYPAWDPAAGHATDAIDIRETVAQLDGHTCMVIPHGGGRTCNLDFFDAAAMPLLEVHSCHRSYDHIAKDAVRRGLRVGFIGGSDDHRGAIGDSHVCARDRFFSSHNGLVAVYAKELTREALWDAFHKRRTYATNGARMVLDVRLDDTLMGGELQAEAGQSLRFCITAWLDGMLDRVELLRGTEVIEERSGRGNKNPTFEHEFELSAVPGETAYWLRVFQTDGGKAWTSPIWVTAR